VKQKAPIVAVKNEAGKVGAPVAKAAAEQVGRMLGALGAPFVEVSVTFVDDFAIRDLNREFRKKNKPTDVLSFPQVDEPLALVGAQSRPPTSGRSPASPALLGDIVISVPTALRQAEERDRSLSREIVTLLAHGLLHLFGFDHRTDAEEREMDAYARVLEAAALSRVPLALTLARPSR
jgi:probable rRNA maturation factor